MLIRRSIKIMDILLRFLLKIGGFFAFAFVFMIVSGILAPLFSLAAIGFWTSCLVALVIIIVGGLFKIGLDLFDLGELTNAVGISVFRK